MNTSELRSHFLIETLFVPDAATHFYSHFDRLIVGGVMPSTKSVKLDAFPELRASYYLERREIGIINVGAAGTVTADGQRYDLGFKEALYIGRGTKDISFTSSPAGSSLFYFNSASAHTTYSNRKVKLDEAETAEMGAAETANLRTIRKLLVSSVLPTCQLQMGLTELKPGSVWNTMPPHTHTRRMEAYFYFGLNEKHSVSHFMGEPEETRHLWVANHQAVISPPWSIHCGVGTSNYSFIWGMAGENLDYTDMDALQVNQLR